MRQITSEDLACMEVINLCDGGRLGYAENLEISVDDGRVTALLIPQERGFFCFGKGEWYRIPWCRIECIGEDTVLVKLSASELAGCCCRPTRRHFGKN